MSLNSLMDSSEPQSVMQEHMVVPLRSMPAAAVHAGAPMWPIPYQGPNRQLKELLSALEQEARPPLIYSGDVGGSLARLRSDLVSHHAQLSHALDKNSPVRGLPGSTPLVAGALEPSAGALMEYVQQPNHDLQNAARRIRDSVSPSSALSSHQPALLQLTHGLAAQGALMATGANRLEWANKPLAGLQSSLIPSHHALAIRAASLPVTQPQDRGSLFVAEQSALLYPPIGATFEGYRSKAAHAVQIDSLSDFVHRSKAPRPTQQVDDWQPGTAVRRAGKHEGDQLDIFLKNYMHSGVKPSFDQASANAKAVSLLKVATQHELNYHLARFAA